MDPAVVTHGRSLWRRCTGQRNTGQWTLQTSVRCDVPRLLHRPTQHRSMDTETGEIPLLHSHVAPANATPVNGHVFLLGALYGPRRCTGQRNTGQWTPANRKEEEPATGRCTGQRNTGQWTPVCIILVSVKSQVAPANATPVNGHSQWQDKQTGANRCTGQRNTGQWTQSRPARAASRAGRCTGQRNTGQWTLQEVQLMVPRIIVAPANATPVNGHVMAVILFKSVFQLYRPMRSYITTIPLSSLISAGPIVKAASRAASSLLPRSTIST